MRFFDCNAYFGLPSIRPVTPVQTSEKLLAAMDRAGVEKALVYHIAQHDHAPRLGNQLLTEAIKDHPRLVGCWTVLPNQGHEFPEPGEFFAQMKAARITALRVFPETHRFLLNAVSMGEILDAMVDVGMPLILSVQRGVNWGDIYQLLSEFPDLVCVVCDHGCWGEDRMFRPLIERYENFYIDTARYLLDGGIESLVTDYGAKRLLFGSGFPDSYMGGMMMAIKHAQIPHSAKQAIACGNLERILDEVRL
jgi:predicted TIM-barrel fold metal-dependent hydrolase